MQDEGDFGDIKANTDYVKIQRRGKRSVQTELTLVALGYNLGKFQQEIKENKLRKPSSFEHYKVLLSVSKLDQRLL
ncbi:transposase [Erysipelothrix urinaevulpis]|uniref:transposase n=1 Tax=Erysipelothrix urinaevulpis TaxID=2683717 RepID=UPI001358EBF1